MPADTPLIVIQIIGLAGLVTALGVISHFLWKAAKTVSLIVDLAEATPAVLAIAEQMKPNGGDSMRDRIDVIENRLIHGSGRMDDLQNNLVALTRGQKLMVDRFDKLVETLEVDDG